MEPRKKTLKWMRIAATFCYIVAAIDAWIFFYIKVPLLSPAGLLFLFGFLSTLIFGWALSVYAKKK